MSNIRKQKRLNEKKKAKRNDKVNAPFISLCENFASEYLSGTLEPNFDKQALYDEYNERWKNLARAIISKSPKDYMVIGDFRKTQSIRTNLIGGFERFAEKYMANQDMDKKQG